MIIIVIIIAVVHLQLQCIAELISRCSSCCLSHASVCLTLKYCYLHVLTHLPAEKFPHHSSRHLLHTAPHHEPSRAEPSRAANTRAPLLTHSAALKLGISLLVKLR